MSTDHFSAQPVVHEPAPVEVITYWTGPDDDQTDEAKAQAQARDYLFRRRVAEVVQEQAPWLMKILQQTGGSIVAGPGQFFVMFGGDIERSVEIPALGAHLLLLPWREDDQPAQ